LRELGLDDRASTPELFAARVARSPDSPFLRWSRKEWTYAQAALEVAGFADLIGSLAVTSGRSRVASFLSNCPEAVWATLGTHAAGKTYVPLNRGHKGALLRQLLARSEAAILVADATALGELHSLAECGFEFLLLVGDPGKAVLPSGVQVIRTEPGMAGDPQSLRGSRPDAIATVMFTSGTTGRSKAVRIPHNMLCRGAARFAEACDFRSRDVIHLWAPLFHIFGQLHQMMAMIVAGGCIAVYPTFSRSRFWKEVARDKCTVFCGLPNVLRILWNEPERPEDLTSTLRLGIIAMIPPDIHRRFEERFGVVLLDSYGMTEAEPLTLPDLSRPAPLGSCGRESPDFEIRIVDDQEEPSPTGALGQILVRPRASDVMMSGYDADSAATVAAWRNLWWHTGDLGYFDEDGFLYVKGRTKDMIRRRGENISAWELEEQLRACPLIANCAVLAIPSPLGEDDVAAAIVPTGPGVTEDQIRAYCLANMASFMVPQLIRFRGDLPLNHVGKVDKLRLFEEIGGVADRSSGRSVPREGCVQ
jgi:crotonobetaine/carnitine-CoA ligase